LHVRVEIAVPYDPRSALGLEDIHKGPESTSSSTAAWIGRGGEIIDYFLVPMADLAAGSILLRESNLERYS